MKKNLGLTAQCTMHNGTFDLEHVKVMLVHFSRKIGVTRKLFITEQNIKIWALGVYVVCIWVHLTLNTCQGHLWSFGALSQKMDYNRKKAYRRGKRTENFSLGVYLECILVFLTLKLPRSFGALFPKMGHNSKKAHQRVKLMKIWVSSVYM